MPVMCWFKCLNVTIRLHGSQSVLMRSRRGGLLHLVDGEGFIGPAPATVNYFVDQNHRVRANGFSEIVDEHCRCPVNDFLLLLRIEDTLRKFEVGEGHL